MCSTYILRQRVQDVDVVWHCMIGKLDSYFAITNHAVPHLQVIQIVGLINLFAIASDLLLFETENRLL